MEAIVEVNGRQISLTLTTEQYARAEMDSEYLSELVRDYYETTNTRTEGHSTNAIEVASSASASTVTEPSAEGSPESPKSLFIWNEACIYLLLSLYEEHKTDFERKRHKVVFDAIARKMHETNQMYNVNGSQCQSKINSLKKQFKKIADHNATSGNDRATWPYFDRMNELFGSTGWVNPVALASEVGPSTEEEPVLQEPKKRKLEFVLEEYRKDLKKHREDRMKTKQENFNKLLELKEKQHREKMQILKTLFPNNRTD